ncbi:MAG: hypothetical protein WBF66_07910 [Dehalococcoidia bacterium]
MAEVLAGFICGYAVALVAAPAVAIALVRSGSARIRLVVPAQTSVAALSVVLHLFALLVFTAVGMLLGLLLMALEERAPEGGLGSPNLVFTGLVLACVVIAVVPISVVVPGIRRPSAAVGLALAGLFGYLMPYLAAWSPLDSG